MHPIQRPQSWWSQYRADVERTYEAPPTLLRSIAGFLFHAGLRATLLHRIAHRFWRRRALRPLAAVLKRAGTALTGAEIHPAAQLGGGVHLPHPTGVVIGPTVVIQGPATIFQQVTLGPRGAAGAPGSGPRLGPYTSIYPGARVLGAIQLGARVQVGPNCVVYRSLADGTTVLPAEPTVLEGLSFTLRFETEGEKAAHDLTGAPA